MMIIAGPLPVPVSGAKVDGGSKATPRGTKRGRPISGPDSDIPVNKKTKRGMGHLTFMYLP